MTHDEAYSFYNVKHFWWIETLCTGNTHWFNFLAIKTAVILGLEKAWHLRWFTLLSSGIFLLVIYHWIKRIEQPAAKFFAFSLVLLNPYMLEYFSFARGYATGLMFEGLAIVSLLKALKEDNRRYYTIALFSSGMSAIANFNFFYFFSAFALLYFYENFFKKGFDFYKKPWFYLDIFFSLGIVGLVLKALWFITDCSNDIGSYGGSNFFDSLFSGYIKGFMYHKSSENNDVIKVLTYLVFCLVLIFCLFGVFQFKKHQNKFYQITSIIIIMILGFCVINKVAFGVLYPIDRTTLMLFPMFGIVTVKFIQNILIEHRFKNALFLSFTVVLFVNFFSSFSFIKTYDYSEQRDAKKAFEFVEHENAKKVGIAPELFGVFRNYYQMTDQYHFSFVGESLNAQALKELSGNMIKFGEFDYFILYPPYNLGFCKQSSQNVKAVKYFPNTGTLVIKLEKSYKQPVYKIDSK